MARDDRPLMRALRGEALPVPPVWLMRQAGRYLPEYRAVRARAGSFLDLCYTPELAAEVTLQPIRRFGFDAAILFADILLVPHALGADLASSRARGRGSRPVTSPADLARLRPVERDPRDAGAGLRDRAAVRAALPPRGAADRLRRRALDGRDLHDRRARDARPGAGARRCSTATRATFDALIERLTDGDDRLPRRAGRGRRRGGEALRQLGRRAARAALRALRDRARAPDRRGGAGRRIPTCR